MKQLSKEVQESFLEILKLRFEINKQRHSKIEWPDVALKLKSNSDKLWSLYEMDRTGGEPDVVGIDKETNEFTFFDCSPESPIGRRSICFDLKGLESRKEFKPANNAIDMASTMGIEMLNEDQYRTLQKLGPFDTKTSSWITTPEEFRKLGGALFAEFRYGKVFVYHNGAQSYYAVRGFRGCLKV